MKILSTLIITMSLFSLQAFAKGKGLGVYRMGLGVASPSHLGAYNPSGVRFNEGGGFSITHTAIGTSSVSGLHGHYGADSFGLRGSYFAYDPEGANDDNTDIAVAGGTTNFTLGVTDDSDYGILFNIGKSFRFGLSGNTDSETNTLGIAYDMSSITFDLDYGVDGTNTDYSLMRLGLGFNGGMFFAGFVHTIVKIATVSADSTTATLGMGKDSWIFSIDYTPVENSDDITGAKFTMNF